jgi:hypothetical protein
MWITNSHRHRDVHGEDREGGSDGSYGEQDSGVSGLDEDLWWSRSYFYRTGWLHKGHQHCQRYLSSCGRLRTHPSSLLPHSTRTLRRRLKPLTPQVLHHSFTRISQPPLAWSSSPRLPQYRASAPRPRPPQLRYTHFANDAGGRGHARSYTLP